MDAELYAVVDLFFGRSVGLHLSLPPSLSLLSLSLPFPPSCSKCSRGSPKDPEPKDKPRLQGSVPPGRCAGSATPSLQASEGKAAAFKGIAFNEWIELVPELLPVALNYLWLDRPSCN